MAPRRFHNSWPHAPQRLRDILRWKLGLLSENTPAQPGAPDEPAPVTPLNPGSVANPPAIGWHVVWLGHASFLIQGCGLSILIDPIFSDHCSPVPIASLRRKIPPPCALADLPPIDIVLLTHGHYDHLDLPTLRALPGRQRVITAEGHAPWLAGKLGRDVEELPVHGKIQLTHGISVTATPAQHFTARTPFDRNRAHWCGWLIEGDGRKLWHAGDSGYSRDFADIGRRHGPIDFAMIPIGAYQPREIMKPVHMNPEEAVQAFIDTACRRAVAMHWGTFTLTDEPMSEPPLRLRMEMERRNLPPEIFTAPPVGTLISIGPAPT